jgi:S1-C subfamily serine protease
MSMDDDGEDDAVGRVPPPPPDDRLWRHPSEVSSFGGGRLSAPLSPIAAPSERHPVWPIALVAAFVGAVLCSGVLALTGNLSVDPEQVIERVKVTPNVPALGLPDDQTVAAVKDRVSPAVVRLRVTGPDGDSQASGVVVRDDGIVVTSAHEIVGATAITVELADGRHAEGTLVGADLPTDVGVITIEARGLAVAVLGSSEDLDAGAATVAIGTTSEGEPAVATGVISAMGRRLDAGAESLHGLIQTDAPIEAEWAGGPLLDASGNVIGITTDLAGDHSRFGFATPIELVHLLTDELLAYGKITRGWLGVEGADLSDAKADLMGVRGGAEVRRVMPGSPAARSGLEEGDVITSVSGERVRSSSDLVVVLRTHKPGEVVVVGYWRSGRNYKAEVTIDHDPAS